MTKEIKALTSARGIAACLVMIYHFHQLDNISSEALLSFIKKGYLWVDFFFVLSGFVMAMTYNAKFAGSYSWHNHKEFLLRRIGRIYPMYIFITLVISAYSLIVYGGYSGVHRPAVNLDDPVLAHITNIFMIQAWGFGKSIGGPTWSISTEWAAYLLFPILIHLAIFSRLHFSWLAALAASMCLYYIAGTYVPSKSQNGQLDVYYGINALPLLRCISGFYFGLFIFRFVKTKEIFFIYKDSAALAIIFCLILLMAINANDLLIYPFLPLFVLTLYGNKGYVARFFANQLFYMLGLLSYSIYLLHHHFLVLLTQLQIRLSVYMPQMAANITAAAIVYSLVIGGAYLCYRYIEKPSRKWFRRYSHKE